MKNIFTRRRPQHHRPCEACPPPPHPQMNDGRYWMSPSICFPLLTSPTTFSQTQFWSAPTSESGDQKNPAVNWCIISCKRCERKKKIWLPKYLRTRVDLRKCFLAIFTKRKQVGCPNYVVPCNPSRTFRKFSFPIIWLSTSFLSCADLLAAGASLQASACLLADAQLAWNDAEVRHCCWFVLGERQQERTTQRQMGREVKERRVERPQTSRKNSDNSLEEFWLALISLGLKEDLKVRLVV